MENHSILLSRALNVKKDQGILQWMPMKLSELIERLVSLLAPLLAILTNLSAVRVIDYLVKLLLLYLVVRSISHNFLFNKVSKERMIRSLKMCREDLRREMKRMLCSPLMLRLAWSDCATHDKNAKFWPECGGATGAIRFEAEIRHDNNRGLFKAVKLLENVKRRHDDISWADLIQMAGVLAVEITGGPVINIRYGRIDAPNFHEEVNIMSYPIQDLNAARNKTGKGPRILHHHKPSSASSIDGCPYVRQLANRLPKAIGPYPDGAAVPSVHIRNVFYRMGFDNKEIVALCGAHTIGRAFSDRSGVTEHSSGYRGATKYTMATSVVRDDGEPGVGMPGGCSWTKNWLTFDNSYYRNAFAGTDKAAYMSTVADKEKDDSYENHLFSAISNPMRMTTNPKARNPVNLNQLLRLRDPQLLWLPTDNALETDPELKSFFFTYAQNQQAWFHDYAAAHKKMSELGAKWAFDNLTL